jgi:phosphoglycolate phosphatase
MAKNYEYVLFDLDGTITESGKGVLNSVNYAMKKLNLPMPSTDEVPSRLFMGPPLSFSFDTYCHVPKERIADALVYYREYYTEKGIMECEVYDGVVDLLKRLSERGKKLLVASSKPETYVIRILENFQIKDYFAFVGGADLEGKRSEKTDVMIYTLKSAGVQNMDTAVMVGDRKYDIIGAKDMHMDSIGVSYGYGSVEELKEAGATYIVSTANEVGSIVLGETE